MSVNVCLHIECESVLRVFFFNSLQVEVGGGLLVFDLNSAVD